MKREIHYYYYPGCLGVILSIENEPGEIYSWQLKRVATLWNLGFRKQGSWEKDACLLTPEERKEIEEKAYDQLRKWIKWSLDPNRDFGYSEEYLNELADEQMSVLKGKYQITS